MLCSILTISVEVSLILNRRFFARRFQRRKLASRGLRRRGDVVGCADSNSRADSGSVRPGSRTAARQLERQVRADMQEAHYQAGGKLQPAPTLEQAVLWEILEPEAARELLSDSRGGCVRRDGWQRVPAQLQLLLRHGDSDPSLRVFWNRAKVGRELLLYSRCSACYSQTLLMWYSWQLNA